MPCIVTTVHDPVALAATCRQLGLRPPEAGADRDAGRAVFGWVVRLPGLHAPVVFDTLTGLAAYHPRDNAFGPYARVMRLDRRYYEVRAALRRAADRRPDHCPTRHSAPAVQVA